MLERLPAFAESQQMKIEYSDRIAPAKATSYHGVIRLLPGMEPARYEVFLRRSFGAGAEARLGDSGCPQT
jgi:hypothetical protein